MVPDRYVLMKESPFNDNGKINRKIHPETIFENSVDFVKDELLDSFDVIELVSNIEKEFSIVIDGLDILPENFKNVDSIVEMIRKAGGNI